jgi:hypothetical protein
MWDSEEDDLFDEDDDLDSFCDSWPTPVKKKTVKKALDKVKSAKVKKTPLNPIENLYMCEQLSPENNLSVHHVLYALGRLTVDEYVSGLKKEMAFSKQTAKQSFMRLVLDDKKWVDIGDNIRERLRDLFKHEGMIEIMKHHKIISPHSTN